MFVVEWDCKKISMLILKEKIISKIMVNFKVILTYLRNWFAIIFDVFLIGYLIIVNYTKKICIFKWFNWNIIFDLLS